MGIRMPTPGLSGLLAMGLCACSAAPETTRWYRGNLHTHSLWSDGNNLPEMISAWYKDHGYHFLGMSDHNILSNHEKWIDVDMIIKRGGRKWLSPCRERFGADWVEMRTGPKGKPQVRLKRLDEYRGRLEVPGEFLLVQAEEISSSFERLPIHMNATNLEKRIPKQRGKSVREVMSKVLAAVARQSRETGRPILTHLNHPNFGWGITAEDLAAVTEERFFEVWNGHPSIHHRGDALHASVERLWDIANTLRIAKLNAPPLFGLGTDDSHHYFNEDPKRALLGRGWVQVRAATLAPDALIAAMDAGEFYASSGVKLRTMHCTEEAIELEVEPVGDETYTTQFIGTLVDYDDKSEVVTDKSGKPIRATLRYSADVGHVLKTVQGRRARYALTGKELYVRAVVTSSAAPERPVWKDQRKKAWTQPVGWRHRVPR